ncbi:phage late control protein GPD [compost metagenome]
MIDQALSQIDGYLNDAQASMREAKAYPRPICRMEVDGRDITAAIEKRLMIIELTDNRGLAADQLDVTLSDHDGRLVIPPKGASLRLWLGWSDTGLVDKGSYTVDETEHSGAPDQLNIRARSVDMSAGLKVKRERSWHNETIESVVQAIAGAYGLGPLVSAALSAIKLVHLDQANESDANLLSRLGQEHDAIATVKAGRLLFMPIGNATSASGLNLPHITLTRRDGDQHRFLQADRDSYTGVRAFYYDVNSAEKKEAISGGGDNIKDLRHSYTDQKTALVAARAEWNKLQRGTATLSYTLARGRPDLTPELTYSLTGIKQEIADIIWLGGNVKHSFTSDSFTTSLELESKLPDGDEVAELADDAKDYSGIVAWYRDKKSEKQQKLTEGDQSKPKRLTHLYESKASAQRAVDREYKRLQAKNGAATTGTPA